MNPAREDFILAASSAIVSWPFTHSRSTLALKAGLCLLRPFDSSCSFSTATGALNLGAGLSLVYLSYFPGPPPEMLSTCPDYIQFHSVPFLSGS